MGSVLLGYFRQVVQLLGGYFHQFRRCAMILMRERIFNSREGLYSSKLCGRGGLTMLKGKGRRRRSCRDMAKVHAGVVQDYTHCGISCRDLALVQHLQLTTITNIYKFDFPSSQMGDFPPNDEFHFKIRILA
ncbi:hypothetical protein J6590_035651 [Homalodisca vitripennis]|nr:hypothetical protein J6590_035651 [Homalodisca vitripennis]